MTSPAPTEFIVVRHGETAWNAEGRLQGHLDSELTPVGVLQAEAIAERLAAERFDALYSSDLHRALTTAQAIARRTGRRIITDPRLRERNLGAFQGLTTAEVEQRFPEEYRRFVSHEPDYAVPNGESPRQRFQRTTACLEEIARRRPGTRIVVVTHGGTLNALLRRALDIGLDRPLRYRLYNASLNTFFIQDGQWTLGTWGDIEHLQRIGSREAGIEARA